MNDLNDQPPIDPIQSKPGRRNVALIVVIIVFVILGIMAFANRARQPTSNGNTNQTNRFTIGQEVRINFNDDRESTTGVALLAVDEQTLVEFVTIANTGDEAGLDKLFDERRLVSIQNGTRVRVLKETSGRARIRVIEGEATGSEGWTTTQFLVPLTGL